MDRRNFLLASAATAVASTVTLSTSEALADTEPVKLTGVAGGKGEPLGGQPPAGAKTSIKDFDYEVKYHRAFEAVLWNMPAIAIYSFRRAAFDELGLKDNDIITYPHTPRVGVRFIEIKVDSTDVRGFENINADAMRANKPCGSGYGTKTAQFSHENIVCPLQAKAPHDEFFCPRHLSVPERNGCFYRISVHAFSSA
ncbi:hypothetical protein HNQ50_002461 [Silvimonas terrae]|uniref:Secreted protein n=1 Tax=Silvimonas terrae TaxID=300266 RepID=A0A840RHQ8_9NEIS|nr:hypothetical protein [Silvimonas terrae]MBB5191731.1 hypothetical protein [Silvimonas terrae]